MNEEIQLIFSKVLYKKILNIDCKEYVYYLKKYNLNYRTPDNKNKVYISLNKKILDDVIEFVDLKKILLNEFIFFKDNYLKYTNNNFEITTSWISKSSENQSADFHKHTNSFYSGIIYLQTNKNCGNISFHNVMASNSVFVMPSTHNKFNSNECEISVKDGLLIFFPSEVYHKIGVNASNEERIAVAFNIMPIGPTGAGDSFYVY